MIADIPNLTKDQLEIAKRQVEKSHAECPDQLKGGRVHDTFKFASLDDNRDAHFCITCGLTFTRPRRL
jgi:hypothetical protein